MRSFDDDIDLKSLMQALGRRWLLIAGVTVTCGAVALFFAGSQPVQYETSTVLVLAPEREGDTLPASVSTVRALLASPALVAQALQQVKVDRTDEAEAFARQAITVDEVPGTPYARLRVRASDPGDAARVAQTLIAGAVASGTQYDRSAAADLSQELTVQIEKAGERMADAGRQVLDYRQKHGIGGRVLEPGGASTRVERVRPSGPGRADAEGGRRPAGTALSTVVDLSKVSRSQMELIRLETDFEVARQVYAELAARREFAIARSAESGPLFRLLDQDVAPGRALSRGRARKTAIGLVLGMLIGIALAVAIEARSASRHRAAAG